MDVINRLQTGLKSLQSLDVYESLFSQVVEFSENSLSAIESVHTKLQEHVNQCQQVYELSKTEQPTSISNRIEQLRQITNREELKKQLQVCMSCSKQVETRR